MKAQNGIESNILKSLKFSKWIHHHLVWLTQAIDHREINLFFPAGIQVLKYKKILFSTEKKNHQKNLLSKVSRKRGGNVSKVGGNVWGRSQECWRRGGNVRKKEGMFGLEEGMFVEEQGRKQ